MPNDIPNYLPLKIALLGHSFAGKKTIATILKSKYGVEIINPEQIFKEAVEYAFPPQEDDKDKKKAIQKRGKETGVGGRKKGQSPAKAARSRNK